MKNKFKLLFGICAICFSLMAFVPKPSPGPEECVEFIFDWNYQEYRSGECKYYGVHAGYTRACNLQIPNDECEHWECDEEMAGCVWHELPPS